MKMPGRARSTAKQKFFIPLLLLVAWFGGRYWYFTPSVGAEEMAAEFTAMRADGQTFSLSDLRGGYVLLDFWGSWCGPCRRESPALVALHRDYGDRLTIVSIAIERDSSSWQRARAQDARLWPYQVMDNTESLKFLGGEITDLYGVNQVPTNFLIGPAGEVIDVNADVSAISRLLR